MDLPAKINEPDAFPLSKTEVDWHNLLVTSKELFGRSLTRGLDEWGLKVKSLSSLLAVLEEFRSPGSNPHHALISGPLEFVHQSFLVKCPHAVILQVASIQKLQFLIPPEYITEEIAVFAGTLRDWKETLIQVLKPASSRDARLLFIKILAHFERLGLGQTFRDYAKRDAKDGTYYLELK